MTFAQSPMPRAILSDSLGQKLPTKLVNYLFSLRFFLARTPNSV
jgi:hypothetical protein